LFDIPLFKSREAHNKKAVTDSVTAFAAVGEGSNPAESGTISYMLAWIKRSGTDK
jgi:hypothetical protein